MKLKKIDLSKRCAPESGGGGDNDHPDILQKDGDKWVKYLAKIHDYWYLGFFTRQWHGWNFSNRVTSGIKLNSIQELYQVLRFPGGIKC